MATKLFEDHKMVNDIAQNFFATEEKARSLCKKMDELQKELCKATTKTEFDTIVKKLIAQGNEAQEFLSSLKTREENKTLSLVLHNSIFIGKLSKYANGASNGSLSTKDLLQLEQQIKNLTAAQKNEARHFIKTIRELQLVAEALIGQEEKLKTRINEADSLEIVEEIEAEILEKNNIIEGALNRLVPYPQDEAIADALVNFLQTNNSLLNIMQSFDIYASLEDDLADAKEATVTNNRSLNSCR